jgi:hypothetical protein
MNPIWKSAFAAMAVLALAATTASAQYFPVAPGRSGANGYYGGNNGYGPVNAWGYGATPGMGNCPGGRCPVPVANCPGGRCPTSVANCPGGRCPTGNGYGLPATGYYGGFDDGLGNGYGNGIGYGDNNYGYGTGYGDARRLPVGGCANGQCTPGSAGRVPVNPNLGRLPSNNSPFYGDDFGVTSRPRTTPSNNWDRAPRNDFNRFDRPLPLPNAGSSRSPFYP